MRKVNKTTKTQPVIELLKLSYDFNRLEEDIKGGKNINFTLARHELVNKGLTAEQQKILQEHLMGIADLLGASLIVSLNNKKEELERAVRDGK